MAAASPERTAFLSIRVWLEGDSESSLRARITWTLDTSAYKETTAVAARTEEIELTVARWLDEFLASAR